LSRHRKIQCSVIRSRVIRSRVIRSRRSRAVALIAAGAFVATAATAAAATWTSGPSGPATGRAHEAGAGSLLTVTGQMFRMQAFQQSTASQAVQAYQIRDAAAELAATHWNTAREQAAKAAKAAKKAAAAREQAAAQPAAQSSAQPAATAQPAQAATVAAAPAASGSPQQIAEAMLASFGWSSSQFSCLDPLWAHESGWSVTAYNAGSGAYGIPQALPGSRMASAGPDWQTNAATQIRWGLEYIEGTYGSPCAAWGHEQATGWY
jgi:hypothetical protein